MLKPRYIPQLKESLPPLGFGVMRLPMNGTSFPDEVYQLLSKAMELGVNYFDTGWTYQNGQAERLINEAIVNRYSRDSFFIAAKLPVWDCRTWDDIENIFEAQLKNLGVEYIDFYLAHCLTKERWSSMQEIGMTDFFEKKMKEGRIKHIGFSFHDTPTVLEKIISSFDWDFIQIQINYLDWIIRNAKRMYEISVEKNLPCFVMEPVAGGRLSSLPQEMEKVFSSVHADWSISEWAMRFVGELPNATVTLSGMNTAQQLEENVRTFSDIRELSRDEKDAVDHVSEQIRSREVVSCSGCGYCLRVCPKHIAIPGLLQTYNESMLENMPKLLLSRWTDWMSGGQRADACIQCGACAEQCPQKIPIPHYMQEITEKIEQWTAEWFLGTTVENIQAEVDPASIVVCFGAGKDGLLAKKFLEKSSLAHQIFFTCNTERRWGTEFEGCEIINPQKLLEWAGEKKAFHILITTRNYRHMIAEQLQEMGLKQFVIE